MSLPYPSRQLYYDGRPQPAISNHTFQSIDPSTATPLADIHTASPQDIDSAISSAQRAFPSWSTTPPIQRARILLKAVALLRERNDALAEIETRDTGKPFSETSTVDVTTGADVLEYFANLVGGGGLNGETVQLREDAWVYTRKEALGVCAGIGAWNYPLQIVSSALATTTSQQQSCRECEEGAKVLTDCVRNNRPCGSPLPVSLPATPWSTSPVK